MTSYIHGFSVVKYGAPELGKFKVPGTTTTLSLRREIAKLMIGFARDFHTDVEKLNPKSCWGHAPRKIKNSSKWSFHAPGIAMDLNASDHPQGKSGTFSNNQEKALRKLLKNYSYQGVRLFRWGGDFSTTVDEMHVELIVPRDLALKAAGQQGSGAPAAQVAHKPGSRALSVKNPLLSGDDVEYVQRWVGENRVGAIDGDYGDDTAAGVRWYQGMRGIPVTGTCDRVTWENMKIKVTF